LIALVVERDDLVAESVEQRDVGVSAVECRGRPLSDHLACLPVVGREDAVDRIDRIRDVIEHDDLDACVPRLREGVDDWLPVGRDEDPVLTERDCVLDGLDLRVHVVEVLARSHREVDPGLLGCILCTVL
jgi:hypothetical protein